MSLTSRSVWGAAGDTGALCPSQAMSGNMSRVIEGNCTFGFTPEGWRDPGGTPGKDGWDAIPGVSYGTLSSGTGATCLEYSGGTSFEAVFGGSDMPMREILCDNLASTESHAVAAWLNAAGVPGYPYTQTQVEDLYRDLDPMDFEDLMAATW